LRELVNNPGTPMGKIPAPNTAELIQKLSEWNNTIASYPKDIPLHQLISKRAKEIPAKTAITFGNKKLNYKTLDEQANQLAAILRRNNVKKGDKVAIALDRS